jgi:hypothetical protein
MKVLHTLEGTGTAKQLGKRLQIRKHTTFFKVNDSDLPMTTYEVFYDNWMEI